MGGKARVHELAKELGVTAKEVLARLSEQGEFIKSASSTVEAPVARRLREAYQAQNKAAGRRGAGGRSPVSAKPFTTSPVTPTVSRIAGSPAAPRRLTSSQAANVCKRFRQASASGQDQSAINQLYSECAHQYGFSQETLRAVVAEDLNRHRSAYVAKRKSSKRAAEVSRPRPRTGSLHPEVDAVNTEGVVDLIVNIDASQDDPDEVRASVQDFIPNDAGRYGYLAWRYSAAHRRMYPGLSSRTAHHSLAVMAHVVGGRQHQTNSWRQARAAQRAHRGRRNAFDRRRSTAQPSSAKRIQNWSPCTRDGMTSFGNSETSPPP